MRFSLTVLGCSSAIPTSSRNPSSQLLNVNEQYYLIDCGEGTQVQLRRNKVKVQRIHNIFISHLHGDHYFGLVGLITSMQLLGRDAPLTIYGPEPLWEIIQLQLKASGTRLRFELSFQAIPSKEVTCLFENNRLEVHSFPLRHRIPCTGFRFTEKKHLRKINLKATDHYQVPVAYMNRIKQGEDYIREDGTVVLNEEMTFPGPPSRSFAYCSDTIYHEPNVEHIKGVDLLYHESTFTEEMRDRANETFHSTAKDAANIARQAKCRYLLIGHYSARYKELEPFAREAQEIFPETHLAVEGKTYEIPIDPNLGLKVSPVDATTT